MRNCNVMRKSSIDEAKQDTRWGGVGPFAG